jgi:hypothetical protein
VLIVTVAVLVGALGTTSAILTEVILPKLRDRLGSEDFRGFDGSARALGIESNGKVKRQVRIIRLNRLKVVANLYKFWCADREREREREEPVPDHLCGAKWCGTTFPTSNSANFGSSHFHMVIIA